MGNVQQRTKTALQSLNPVWNEEFEFDAISEQHGMLRIALYDAETDEFCGAGVMRLSRLGLTKSKQNPA